MERPACTEGSQREPHTSEDVKERYKSARTSPRFHFRAAYTEPGIIKHTTMCQDRSFGKARSARGIQKQRGVVRRNSGLPLGKCSATGLWGHHASRGHFTEER